MPVATERSGPFSFGFALAEVARCELTSLLAVAAHDDDARFDNLQCGVYAALSDDYLKFVASDSAFRYLYLSTILATSGKTEFPCLQCAAKDGRRRQMTIGTVASRARLPSPTLHSTVRTTVNAIEAVSESGDTKKWVWIRLRQIKGEVELAIEDNLCGVTPDLAERLFEPFETSKLHGMGLGLSLSHEIVKAHGGRLWRDATATTGARFMLRLPCDRVGHS